MSTASLSVLLGEEWWRVIDEGFCLPDLGGEGLHLRHQRRLAARLMRHTQTTNTYNGHQAT